MHPDYLYKETIYLRDLTTLLGIFTAIFLCLFVYQILAGPLGEDPAPNWFFLSMFILFLFITINFSRLSITMTSRSIVVGYGMFKRTIFWENIERCYIDEISSIRYGGWGIRIGRVKGRWRLVYNVIGGPRVVLGLKRGLFTEFVFSTKNPDEVMRVVRHMTGD